jgi:hypothetical protein
MKRFILLAAAVTLLVAACSDKPYPPGTKVEIICQEHCDVPIVGSYVEKYLEPGKSETVGSDRPGNQVEILNSMDYDGVLYYKIRAGQIRGWVTAEHIK